MYVGRRFRPDSANRNFVLNLLCIFFCIRTVSTDSLEPFQGWLSYEFYSVETIMQFSNTWKRMLVTALSLSFVAYFAFDPAKPGRDASDSELAAIRATATIKGNCMPGAACSFTASQPPDVVAGMCVGNGASGTCGTTGGKYCGTCSGAADQICTAMSTSPYNCDDALPDQNCCDLTLSCETTSWLIFWNTCYCSGTPAVPFTAVTRKRC